MSGFWIRQVDLYRILIVRDSEDSFRTGVFDALEGTRVGCLLGESIRRRFVLLGPAPPRRPAVRHLEFRLWYLQVLESTGEHNDRMTTDAVDRRLFFL